MTSPYFYPGTDTFINKLDIRDPEKLRQLEYALTSQRLAELYVKPVKGNLDVKHLQDIHKHIFQDLYPWAGKPRTVTISKGTTRFCPAEYLKENMATISNSIKKSPITSGVDFPQFAKEAEKIWGDLNMLHPFREGNGRSTREFMRLLSGASGYELDFSRAKPADFIVAARSDFYFPLLSQITVNQQPNRELQQTMKKALVPSRTR